MHLNENQEDKLVLSRMLQEGLYTTAHSQLLSVVQHIAQHTGDLVSPCIREQSVGNNPSE